MIDGSSTHERNEKKWKLKIYYIDDVVIATPTLEHHIERLDEVSTCMKQARLKGKTVQERDPEDIHKVSGSPSRQTRSQTGP